MLFNSPKFTTQDAAHPRVLFTGGGTAGHVIPNLALMSVAWARKWDISYIGSYQGIERQLVQNQGVVYYAISSGKLRRYFSLRTLIDPFKILWGILQSWRLLKHIQPQVVFSKGGYVAFPVVFAAWLRRIPVLAHESDLTPGLANRLSFRYVKRLCVTFKETAAHFPDKTKVVVTGTPLRQGLFEGVRERGLALAGFSAEKPVLLIMAGGSGSLAINAAVRAKLEPLLKQFQILHICGDRQVDGHYLNVPGYQQYGYVDEQLPHFLAAADIVLSRAGANSIYELLALVKPHVLIPLPKAASRGDQLQNADYFAKLGTALVCPQEALDSQLMPVIEQLWQAREVFRERIAAFHAQNGTEAVLKEIAKEWA
jgi:UDP-N-acetylglucosamine--N-acetylmuramyl-(pentapeptide) pyrophosphoryl-undecaprenol N-acetylglucosamine transferase